MRTGVLAPLILATLTLLDVTGVATASDRATRPEFLAPSVGLGPAFRAPPPGVTEERTLLPSGYRKAEILQGGSPEFLARPSESAAWTRSSTGRDVGDRPFGARPRAGGRPLFLAPYRD